LTHRTIGNDAGSQKRDFVVKGTAVFAWNKEFSSELAESISLTRDAQQTLNVDHLPTISARRPSWSRRCAVA
jgi:hypothetical protein